MKLLHRVPAKLPKVDPIVPVLRRAPFNDRAWLFEPKYDGFRGMVDHAYNQQRGGLSPQMY